MRERKIVSVRQGEGVVCVGGCAWGGVCVCVGVFVIIEAPFQSAETEFSRNFEYQMIVIMIPAATLLSMAKHAKHLQLS